MPLQPGKPVTNANLEGIGGGFIDQVIFTASGSFTKASYPTATRAHVRVQGAGGGGGGAAAAATGQHSPTGNGDAGGYAKAWPDLTPLAA